MARYVWQPQPGPQTSLVNCPVDEICYGGARGGGKTDGMLGKNAIKAQLYGKHQRAVFFRRKQIELEDAIARAHEIYGPLGWEWHDQKKTYTSPNGATLRFRYLERDKDAMLYQGHSYTDVYIEEAGAFASVGPINKLRATLRSGHGIPCQLHLTCNPGGPGHQWIKQRYIDPYPDGMRVFKEKLQGMNPGSFIENRFVFIPAKLKDNAYLGDDYVAKLRMVGSEALVQAWLQGDWNVVDGAYFSEWRPELVLQPFQIPDNWMKFGAFDWGSARPFCYQWWTIASEAVVRRNVVVPRHAMICYREWYGAKGPNVGLRLTADEVGKGIRQKTEEKMSYHVADPAIFVEDGGPSIRERMGIPFYQAKNKRVSSAGRLGGWDILRQRMVGIDGNPMIFWFNTCTDSIRTIPMLQHDETNPEDLDTEAEDHAADTTRYAAASRPWATQQAKEEQLDKWDKRFMAAEQSYYDGAGSWLAR